MITRIEDRAAKHQYQIEYRGKASTGDTFRGSVLVDANNRTQAGARVRKCGLEVQSVNMVG